MKDQEVKKPCMQLNEIQMGMLHDIMQDSPGDYYIAQIGLTIQSELSVELFRLAWEKLINQYADIFSLTIQNSEEQLYAIQENLTVPFSYYDLSSLTEAEQSLELNNKMKQDLQTPFNLENPPLTRIVLYQLKNDKYFLLWTKHHLLMDGMGSYRSLNSLFKIYFLLQSSKEATLSRSFSAIKNQSPDNHSEAFWRSFLKDYEEAGRLFSPASLSTNKKTYLSKEKSFLLDNALSEQLKKYARCHTLSVHSILQGVLGIVLSIYSNHRKVLFGNVRRFPHRSDYDVGLLTNTLPFAISVDPDQTLIDYFSHIVSCNQKIRAYATSPLRLIRQWSGFPLALPLFETVFDFKPFSLDEALNQDFPHIQFHSELHLRIPYPMSIAVVQRERHFSFTFSYDAQQFNLDYIEQIYQDYVRTLSDVVNERKHFVGDIDTLSKADYKKIMGIWSGNGNLVATTKPLHQHIELQAEQYSKHIALIYHDESITYEVLNASANQFARLLKANKITVETRVGLCFFSSINQYIALLGILKCGATLVPIDPNYPLHRIQYILQNSAPVLLLTENRTYQKLGVALNGLDILVWKTEEKIAECNQLPSHNLNLPVSTQSAAYIVFTSGSTGQPKGVVVEHRQWMAMMQSCAQRFHLTSADRILQVSSFGFDVFQADWGLASIAGASLCLFDNVPFASEHMISALKQYGITFVVCASSLIESLPKTHLPNLKAIATGGERCALKTIQFWSKERRFYHVYGITETAIISTVHECQQEEPTLPIGKPVCGAEVYILNEGKQPCPVYVPGELHIGGEGVARGYWNDIEKTDQQFIMQEFKGFDKKRLYRTGDIGRWLPNSEIEFLYRKDSQVKIQGSRIELSEVEFYIRRCQGVLDACVLLENENQKKYLIAYIILSNLSMTEKTVRQQLSEFLPTYMLPRFIVFVTDFPRGENGKIQKHLLVSVTSKTRKSHFSNQTKTSSIQEVIVEAIQRVLNSKATIPTESNFFDLGFDSIQLGNLLIKLEKVLPVSLSMVDLLTHTTVNELTHYIQSQEEMTKNEQ